MAEISKHNDLLREFGVTPTYVVDFPIVTQDRSVGPLRELFMEHVCEIGAHLHPWVNPPFDEEVSNRNSYPGNLPPELERAKLERLTTEIEKAFGKKPEVYRAGRYGVGENTAEILCSLGYSIDTSVVARTSFRASEGADFTGWCARPRWMTGARSPLLEVPVTSAVVGLLGGATLLHSKFDRPSLKGLRLPGILARLGLLERIRLTPEGNSFEDLKRLVVAMRSSGQAVFNLIYHSPSISPGHTPYTPNERERQVFLATLCRFLEFFLGDFGGKSVTLSQLRHRLPLPDLGLPSAAAGVARG